MAISLFKHKDIFTVGTFSSRNFVTAGPALLEQALTLQGFFLVTNQHCCRMVNVVFFLSTSSVKLEIQERTAVTEQHHTVPDGRGITAGEQVRWVYYETPVDLI